MIASAVGRPSRDRWVAPVEDFKPLDLLWSKMPEFSWLDIQFQGAVPYALDFLHVVPNLLEHPPNLPIATFDER